MANSFSFLRLSAGVILIAACLLSRGGFAEQVDDRRSVYRFDAGPQGSQVAEGSVGLYPQSAYTPASGFGWTHGSIHGFERLELSRSRNATTIDGVAATRLAFRADVAHGDWHVLVWLSSAHSHTPTVQVLIQNQEQKLGWQRFSAPSEPKRSPPKIYRVLQASTHVGANGFRLELIGAGQEVQLLGISLIRQVRREKSEHQEFLSQLISAGSFRSDDSLQDVVAG